MVEIIIAVTILWFLLGNGAAYSLIGDSGYFYPVYNFGPLNKLNKNQGKEDNWEENTRLNKRNKFLLTLGGGFSLIFAAGYWLVYGISYSISYIKYIFKW